MIEMSDVYADPFDYVENAVFAHRLVGHYQAVELAQVASYAVATEHDPSRTWKSRRG